MEVEFIKMSPSQNMTVLITSHAAPKEYADIGNALMNYEYVHAEQAGFIVDPLTNKALIRLEMSGGEFCGNAVLAAAAYCTYKEISTTSRFAIESSGSKDPLECEVVTKSPILYKAKAEMPKAQSIYKAEITLEEKKLQGTVVQFQGMTHFLINTWPVKEEFPKILHALKENIQDKAIGIIPYRHMEELTYEIRPFVYVTETDNMFFERSCGSGTLALGIYLAELLRQNSFHIQQPGGTIQTEIGNKNYISTDVKISCEGTAYLE